MSKTKHQGDVEDFLDQLDPRAADAQDATPFREIYQAAQAVGEAEEHLREVVRQARGAGASWTVVGAALGVTKQAAYQRFGR